MQEFVKTLLLVSAICALATVLLPEKNKKLRRAGEFAIALFVLAAIANPIAALREWQFDLDSLHYPEADLPADDYTGDTWSELERAVGEGIARDLATRYGVREADISAAPTLTLENNELTISSLTLTFSGTAAALDLVAVRSYAQDTYSTACEVKANGR
ncbi:MAG: hypothetical protein IJ009_00330 [Clostridia bacterium]|nr:hypothetical protein [Clostridia bacterium]